MRILSQTNDIKGYHGTIGTPTNMYDYSGERLFVGDVVCLVKYGVDGKKYDDYGINFVCEENTDIANWTGKNYQYVMGIANAYNNENFKVLDDVEINTEEWVEKFDAIDSDFRVYKVKDHSQLAIGEKISFLSVVDVADKKVGKMTDNEIVTALECRLEDIANCDKRIKNLTLYHKLKRERVKGLLY